MLHCVNAVEAARAFIAHAVSGLGVALPMRPGGGTV